MDFFTTSWALGICFIFVVGLLPDQPSGYIRRASLAFIGFALFAISLGHLGFIANDILFRPILLWILFCTELNDVFAYMMCLPTSAARRLVDGNYCQTQVPIRHGAAQSEQWS